MFGIWFVFLYFFEDYWWIFFIEWLKFDEIMLDMLVGVYVF